MTYVLVALALGILTLMAFVLGAIWFGGAVLDEFDDEPDAETLEYLDDWRRRR